MRVQTILTLGALFASVFGLALTVDQSASAAQDTWKTKVTICHATSSDNNPYVVATPSMSSVDEPNNANANGHGDHTGPIWQPGAANNSWGDIIPPFTYTKKNGQTATYDGMNWTEEGEKWLKNNCQQPDTPPAPVVNYCDPTQRTGGSVAQWLASANFDGGDCFDYAIDQRCGYLNVAITQQPSPQYPQGPYRAVYTTSGAVETPYYNFPVTFPISKGGAPVEVTWFTVGPEKDYLVNSTFPNFWGGVGQTVTVDTDCEPGQGGEGGETPTTPSEPTEPTKPATPASEAMAEDVVELPNTGGSAAPIVLVGASAIAGLVMAVLTAAKAGIVARL